MRPLALVLFAACWLAFHPPARAQDLEAGMLRLTFLASTAAVGMVSGGLTSASFDGSFGAGMGVGGVLGLVGGYAALHHVNLYRGTPLMLFSGAALGGLVGGALALSIPDGSLLWPAGAMLVFAAVAPVFAEGLELTSGDVAGGSTGMALGLLVGGAVAFSFFGAQTFQETVTAEMLGGVAGFALGVGANRLLSWGAIRWVGPCLGALLGGLGGLLFGMERNESNAPLVTGQLVLGMAAGGALGALLTSWAPEDERRPPEVFPPVSMRVPRSDPPPGLAVTILALGFDEVL